MVVQAGWLGFLAQQLGNPGRVTHISGGARVVVVVDEETNRDIRFVGKAGSSHMLVHPPLHNSTSQDK